jgi:hypothetical protein
MGNEAVERVYIHEFIDIIKQNRAKYLHSISAWWSPISELERNQLLYGAWGTLGSTGQWPQVVNLWEHPSWDNLAASFGMETTPSLQDDSLREWWAGAAELRHGGLDRILVGASGNRGIAQLCAAGVRGTVYAHELVTVPPGGAFEFLDLVADEGQPAVAGIGGPQHLGTFRVAMADDSEAIVLWAFPEWSDWVAYEQAWTPSGALAKWRHQLLEFGARVDRILLLDSPLNPMKTGRQPRVEDRRPLDQI